MLRTSDRISVILRCLSSVFWEGNYHVPLLMRTEVWESTVEVHEHHLTPLVFHSLLQNDDALVFICPSSWNSQDACFESLRIKHMFLCASWPPPCFCYFRFVRCNHCSSFHWAQNAGVRDLLLAACRWICPHFALHVCQVKCYKLLLCIILINRTGLNEEVQMNPSNK